MPNPDSRQSASEIERQLRRREAMKQTGVAALLAFGIPALLFAPVIIGSIYWAIGLLWGMYVPWTWVFVGSFLVLNPLLFWTEWRNGGNYYTDAVLSGRSDSSGSPIFLSGFLDIDAFICVARHPRDSAIGIVELSLWGPRQILEAVRTLRLVRQFGAVNRPQAAMMLRTLLTSDHASPADLIGKAGGTAAAALSYLVWYGWVGISADKSRVWLDSDSRTLLSVRR